MKPTLGRKQLLSAEECDAWFDFTKEYGGDLNVRRALSKARRLLSSKGEVCLDSPTPERPWVDASVANQDIHVYLPKGVFVPYGFLLGRELVYELLKEHDCRRDSIVRDYMIKVETDNAARIRSDPDLLNELQCDTLLFSGSIILKRLSQQETKSRNHAQAELALNLLRFHDNWHNLSNWGNHQTKKTICLVAKYPTAGKSKTRLAAKIGNDKAVEFARCALLDLIERLAKLEGFELVLTFAPAEDESKMRKLIVDELGLEISMKWSLEPFETQDSDNEMEFDNNAMVGLGRGLFRCLRKRISLSREGFVSFIGMDSPHLSSEIIAQSTLVPGTSVICPASDGGYVLLTVFFNQSTNPRVAFENIKWSSACTFAMQLQALQRGKFKTHVHNDAVIQDVDDMEDLLALRDLLKSNPGFSSLCPRVKHMLSNEL